MKWINVVTKNIKKYRVLIFVLMFISIVIIWRMKEYQIEEQLWAQERLVRATQSGYASSTDSSNKSDNLSLDSITTKMSDDDKSFAWTAAISTVKENLKAPSTAKFPFSYYEQDIYKSGTNTFIINSHVDSQNGLGAMVRANFTVKIEKTGENSYNILECKIFE